MPMYTTVNKVDKRIEVRATKFDMNLSCYFDTKVKYLNDKSCGGTLVRITGKSKGLLGCLSCGRVIKYTSLGNQGEVLQDQYHAGNNNIRRRAKKYFDNNKDVYQE